jgi:hypothetical protein
VKDFLNYISLIDHDHDDESSSSSSRHQGVIFPKTVKMFQYVTQVLCEKSFYPVKNSSNL